MAVQPGEQLPAMTQALLARLGAATLGESGAAAMAPRVRPAWPGATVVGRARTARCAPADNLAIHVATATASAGEVLVVELEGEPERATGARCSPPGPRPAAWPGWSSTAACATWPPWWRTASACSPPAWPCAGRPRWAQGRWASRCRWAG